MFMKLRYVALALFLCTTAFVAERVEAADGFVRISTEAEFKQLVVGRKMSFDKSYFTVKKNGGLKGNFGGKALKGAWEWRDGYWCRTLTSHSKNTDCQLWEVNGNQFKATRNRGKGKSFTYIVK